MTMHTIRIDRPCGKSYTFQHGGDHPIHMDFTSEPGAAYPGVEARLDVHTRTPGYTHIKGADAPAIYELITQHILLAKAFTHVDADDIKLVMGGASAHGVVASERCS